MIKYIVVIGVIWAIYFFFIKKKTTINRYKNKQTNDTRDMLKCESCGIYCEVDNSIFNSGKYYCSNECAAQ